MVPEKILPQAKEKVFGNSTEDCDVKDRDFKRKYKVKKHVQSGEGTSRKYDL